MRLQPLIVMLVLLLVAGSELFAQSGIVFRRSGVLNGNQVKTVYGNWGVIGQPGTRGPRGAWIFDTNGYIGDVSLLVGSEVTGRRGNDPVSFFWVVDCPVNRPSNGGFDESINGTRQAFEPVSGYFNENASTPAISGDVASWPPSWPDKLNDPADPGWADSWNGLFGKQPNADLETYFVMDDNNDNEFNIPSENALNVSFRADSTDLSRNGMGLEVKIRGLQWQQILAQDNIFWLYEITNQSTTSYPRTVFGMLVGTYVGVTGGDDNPGEFDDDWSFFDVNEDLTYTGDFGNNMSRNPFWQGDVGLVSYAFLESPGNSFDGIDNDNDADSPGIISNAPFFEEADFDSLIVSNVPNPGAGFISSFVSIDPATFQRTVVDFPVGEDTLVFNSQGRTYTLAVGDTIVEGNRIVDATGVSRSNDNAFDGLDNDFDGLIDENFNLHYLQEKITEDGIVLFSLLNPVRHADYFTGQGSDDALLDERRDDGIDNDGDWSRNPETGEQLFDDDGNLIDDVGEDGIPNTGDRGEYDGLPTAGEPNFDQTDVGESDQIGLSSFNYFSPANEIQMANDESLWRQMRPGFFDVPETIVNGRPIGGEDGDFIYSSGYFPLQAKQTERISLALLYGDDLEDILKKLPVVRQIFESDYRFPIAPNKPILNAIAGDDSVSLYWDRNAENSFDPVLREFDFEGYKIFRSTDPNFNDARTITNSAGNTVAFDPIAQFDLANGNEQWFQASNEIFQLLQGWAFNLGTNSGLQHSYVDFDVQNGRTYYYAVVAYDRGVSGTGVIPSETTKKIVQESNGTIILDVNTASVTPASRAAGYNGVKQAADLEQIFGEGFGSVSYKVLDETALTGNEYEVYFWDTSNDGIDNDGDWSIDDDDVGADGIPNTGDEGEGDGVPTPGEPNFEFRDPEELIGITSRYGVLDLTEFKEFFAARDTFYVELQRSALQEGTVIVQDGGGNVVPSTDYLIDLERGRIRGSEAGSLGRGQYSISYQYNPVFFSPYIQGNPVLDPAQLSSGGELLDTDNFDGLTINFNNIWELDEDTSASTWNKPEIDRTYRIRFFPTTLNGQVLQPVRFPSNYELRISDVVVDSTTDFVPQVPPSPRKFEIYNTTGDYQIEYFHNDINGDQWPSPNENIIFFERDPDGDFTIYTWQFQILNVPGETYQFQGGEVLSLVARFPFNRFDRFRLKTKLPTIDQEVAKSSMDDIRVVPNPYIVAHAFEPSLPPGVTSGRGERIIYFNNLPVDSRISIFTSRGEHVVTLQEDDGIFNGTMTWNLKTKENLDIAYGVYFYVVESDAGVKRGKFAVIK